MCILFATEVTSTHTIYYYIFCAAQLKVSGFDRRDRTGNVGDRVSEMDGANVILLWYVQLSSTVYITSLSCYDMLR